MNPHLDRQEKLPEQVNLPAAKRLLEWLKPYRWTICLNIVFTLILTAMGLVVPKMLKWTIDEMMRATRQTAALKDAAWDRLFILLMTFAGMFVIGAVVSAKPLMQLANALPDLLGSIPAVGLSLEGLPISSLPQTSTMIMGVMLLAVVLMASRMLEE